MRFRTDYTLAAVCLAALLLAAPAVAAPSPQAGEPAPELGNVSWVMNAPMIDKISELKGEVIMVEIWGCNCGPCLRQIPHVQKLHEDYGDRGLHIFTFEAQGSSDEKIRQTMEARGGKTFPVGRGVSGYNTGGGIPQAWVIGVEGTVVFQGRPGSVDKWIKEEIAKVAYPGLGKSEVHDDVRKAAIEFARKKYADAREEAQEVLEDEDAEAGAREDAQYIIDRVNKISEKKWAEAEAFEAGKRYINAQEIFEWFAAHFRGGDEGDKAKDKLKEYRKDKQIKKEMLAQQYFEQVVLKQLTKARDDRERTMILSAFINNSRFEGTQAVADAQEMVANG
jgi:thiol-disulfide isomerase/thioredoxin